MQKLNSLYYFSVFDYCKKVLYLQKMRAIPLMVDINGEEAECNYLSNNFFYGWLRLCDICVLYDLPSK